VEEKRYRESREKTKKLVQKMIEAKEPFTEEKLLQLYESHGVTPEMLAEAGARFKVSAEFYTKLTAKHMQEKVVEERAPMDLSELPPTQILFYQKPHVFKFQAQVLKVLNERFVVLDRTAFYPRAGGQEPDHGWIEGYEVVNVSKYGNVIVHEVKKHRLKVGQVVKCKVDERRRGILTRHHTATHIVNAAAREVLGSWVWQHGTLKDVDRARLDITHFAKLSEEEIQKIEEIANRIVEKNLPVKVQVLPRSKVEQKYGFRIYQGGAVPEKRVRVVSIGEVDHQACGGTHCTSTGEVGYITILRSKRIADGVCRLEYCSGDVALQHLKEQEKILEEAARALKVKPEAVPEAVTKLFERWKKRRKELRKLRKLLKKV
jgi:alanyl-tRNA synthetase